MRPFLKLALVAILATGCATRDPPPPPPRPAAPAGQETEPQRRPPLYVEALVTVFAALAGVAFSKLIGK